MLLYMIVQVIGGIAAAFSFRELFGQSIVLQPQVGFEMTSAIWCEVFYTFMLCFVVLNVAVAKENSPNQFYGLAIGFVIVAGAYGAGAVSGGSFNPAVSIGLNTGSMLRMDCVLIYVMAEFGGAVLAAMFFRLIRQEDFGTEQREPNAASQAASEFLGTFMLVLTVGLNVLAHSPAGAFSIAASLMSMIYALGNVSGAHFNPAVTVAILGSGRLGAGKAVGHMVSQCLGGAVAALAYHQIYASSMASKDGSYFAKGKPTSLSLAPGEGYTLVQAMWVECFFTFVLCYVVLTVAVAKVTHNSTMFGLAIGSCVTVGGNAIGAVSGGSLNPAVSIGIFVGTLVSGGGTATGSNVGAYIGAELGGAVIAACIFKVTHAVDELPGKDKDSQPLVEGDMESYGASDEFRKDA